MSNRNVFLASVSGFFLITALITCQSSLFAASMNFDGHFRAQTGYYNKLGLGLPGKDANKSFISGRALLQPNIIIDDHFTIRSQWTLLTSPNFTPDATNSFGMQAGQGSYIFGDRGAMALQLSRAWLEWTSDFGVLRIGRMPVSWGYGLLYDSGSAIWDDYQTTFDRLEYRLHLGHVIGALAYSKSRKGSVIGSNNDEDIISIFLRYDNPESEFEFGAMYEKQIRSTSQQTALMTTATATTLGLSPLMTSAPHPLTHSVIDAFVKKSMKHFTFGGEITWLTGNSVDFNGDGGLDNLNALALLLSTSYDFHDVRVFMDFLYAGGDENLNDNSNSAFVFLHRNRRPGLILGHELLGDYFQRSGVETVNQGSLIAYNNGAQDSASGVMYLRPGARIKWSEDWASGIELIWAQKAAVKAGEQRSLGVELDIGTDYAVYKNAVLGVTLGYLFAGKGLVTGGGDVSGSFAMKATLGIKL